MLENQTEAKLTSCPFCMGKIVRKGRRKKKYEEVQIYYCKKCKKKFTPGITKNKTYPLRIIIDSLTCYNRLMKISQIQEKMHSAYGIRIPRRTIQNWIREYEEYMPFLRFRDYVDKKYSIKEAIEESRLFHKQVYEFKYHRAKTDIILQEEYRHYRFKPLQQFLELIIAECPHQIFRSDTKRASEFKGNFNFDRVKIIPKNNQAVKITNFVIQSVSNSKMRHEILQSFMIYNDSVTVASEVPVLLDYDDIRHYKYELNFQIPFNLNEGEYITGHIDLIQIRNGSIYVMDFKPSARKEKPLDQLTLYALALSRLTGIRLYHFKCAWFDNKDYFEFFPLHVVYKKRRKRRLPRSQRRLRDIN